METWLVWQRLLKCEYKLFIVILEKNVIFETLQKFGCKSE